MAIRGKINIHDAYFVQHALVLRGGVDGPWRAHGEDDILEKGMEVAVP